MFVASAPLVRQIYFIVHGLWSPAECDRFSCERIDECNLMLHTWIFGSDQELLGRGSCFGTLLHYCSAHWRSLFLLFVTPNESAGGASVQLVRVGAFEPSESVTESHHVNLHSSIQKNDGSCDDEPDPDAQNGRSQQFNDDQLPMGRCKLRQQTLHGDAFSPNNLQFRVNPKVRTRCLDSALSNYHRSFVFSFPSVTGRWCGLFLECGRPRKIRGSVRNCNHVSCSASDTSGRNPLQ